ncbi:MAG TPA: GNAT family N-acetyltransferase [Stellaceae bacterium]|nr:GNAT family N-acetyltransferase [Stellaceae bacterium]
MSRMRLHVQPGRDAWKEVEPLAALVYPPEVLATIVWRDVTWAHADQWVLVYDQERLVSTAGMHLRKGLQDGASVRIGGIGEVMTHPEHRRRGYATAALRHAEKLFRDCGTDFNLLFCEPKNIAFYSGLGWHAFPGDVIVEQPGGRVLFTVTRAMVQAARKSAPSRGTIDLCGLPW